MLLQVDIPTENEAAFKAMLEDRGILPLSYDEVGPAGGNPRWTFVIEDMCEAVVILHFYFGPMGRL